MAGNTGKAFDMGRMAIGGIGQVLDSVEFVKRAWSNLNIPSALVPTMDIEELDKRITDLRAVEQWLNVNLSMLRGTVQALEIQRGTLAAVKAFGSTIGNLPAAASEGRAARPRSGADAAPSTGAAFAPTHAAPSSADAGAPAATFPFGLAPMATADVAAPTPAPAARTERGETRDTTTRAASKSSPRANAGASPGVNPGAWWNLLQQNFNQVAEAAMSGVGLPQVGAPGRRTPGARSTPTGAGTSGTAATKTAGTATRRRSATKTSAAGTSAKREPAVGGRTTPVSRARKAGR